jgi:hypothetical protein
MSNYSGVYICESIVNHLRHGNYIYNFFAMLLAARLSVHFAVYVSALCLTAVAYLSLILPKVSLRYNPMVSTM